MSQQELEKRIADLECTLRQAANVIQHGLEHIKALKAENANERRKRDEYQRRFYEQSEAYSSLKSKVCSCQEMDAALVSMRSEIEALRLDRRKAHRLLCRWADIAEGFGFEGPVVGQTKYFLMRS